MGKSLDELNLKDEPIRQPAPEDFRDTDWYRFSTEIDDLLATGKYTWAESTLTDIQRTVEALKRVSEPQRQAVRNIEAGAQRYRRYEGWRR